MAGDLPDFFASLAGQEIPGGCDRCNAFQTVAEDELFPGVWHMTVHHDDRCAFFRAQAAGSN